VEQGIAVQQHRVLFDPRWGYVRSNPGLIAASPLKEGTLEIVAVAVTAHGAVLQPQSGEARRELVLVQQYSTGTGGKRWPGFRVELGEEARLLGQARTDCGSGGEEWFLVSAPLGWAENIASQFINARDYPSQAITYRPEGLVVDSEFPEGLLVAFGGDKEKARLFLEKVATLDHSALDEHEMSCGRARVRAEVIRVSGDCDFFLGGDPKSLAGFIRPADEGLAEPPADELDSPLAAAFRRAGYGN